MAEIAVASNIAVSRPRRATDVDAHISQRLKAARRLAGLSQTEAATCIGVTFQQLQKYERGSNRISCGNLAKLADTFNQPVAWFFKGAVTERSASADLGTALIGERYGADLARHFLNIDDGARRKVLIDVASALAKAGAT